MAHPLQTLSSKCVSRDLQDACSDLQNPTGTWRLNRHREKLMNENIEIVLIVYSAWIAVGLGALVWAMKDKVHSFLPASLRQMFAQK